MRLSRQVTLAFMIAAVSLVLVTVAAAENPACHISGRVTDGSGNGVAGAEVTVLSDGKPAATLGSNPTTTSSGPPGSGYFTFNLPRTGYYRVVARVTGPTGLAAEAESPVFTVTNDTKELPVNLVLSQNPTPSFLPSPGLTPTPAASLLPTHAATPSALPTPTPSPLPTLAVTPSLSPTATQVATSTLAPTLLPTPTPLPTPAPTLAVTGLPATGAPVTVPASTSIPSAATQAAAATPLPSPGVGPISASSAQTSVDPSINGEILKLTSGYLMYNPPQEMTTGNTERIEVRIAWNNTSVLTEGLKGSGAPIIDDISVSKYMVVKLTGENFRVTSLCNDEQIVSANEPAEWDFDVLPLKSGNQDLHLSVSIKIKSADGTISNKDMPVFDRQIKVRVNPLYSLGTFVEQNWQWVLGGSGIGLATMLWALISSLRKKPEASSEAKTHHRRSEKGPKTPKKQ